MNVLNVVTLTRGARRPTRAASGPGRRQTTARPSPARLRSMKNVRMNANSEDNHTIGATRYYIPSLQ